MTSTATVGIFTTVDEWLAAGNRPTGPRVKLWRRSTFADGQIPATWSGPTWHPCDESGRLTCSCRPRALSPSVERLTRQPITACKRSGAFE